MRRIGPVVAASAVATACIDFGYGFDPDLGHPGHGADAGATATADGGLEGCVEGPVSPSDTGVQIAIITLNVDKRSVTLAAGDSVTWTNADTMRHDVVAGAPGAELPASKGGFASGELAPGAKWAYRFCNPRSLFYFCAAHPQQMNGYRLLVQ